MATAVQLAHGTKFKRGDGATPTETFTDVVEVFSIGAPNLTRATVDATSHDSAAKWREFIGGLRSGGEITLEANYLPANATQGFVTGLGADFADGLAHNYKIVAPSSLITIAFAAIVTGFQPAFPVDGKMGLRVTLQISGPVTFS